MENIKFAIDYLTGNSYKMLEDNNNYAIQSVNLAIEALEKQIPKKPIKLNRLQIADYGKYTKDKCECGNLIIAEVNYCDSCGQKIDWSDI